MNKHFTKTNSKIKKQTLNKAYQYSYIGKKKKKLNNKKIWIKKINAYLKSYKNFTYSNIFYNFRKNKIVLNKKTFCLILFYTNKKNILKY